MGTEKIIDYLFLIVYSYIHLKLFRFTQGMSCLLNCLKIVMYYALIQCSGPKVANLDGRGCPFYMRKLGLKILKGMVYRKLLYMIPLNGTIVPIFLTTNQHNLINVYLRSHLLSFIVRCDRFLSLWEAERCKMIEMSCDQHDEYAANSQFITHLTGRILWQQNLMPTPIDTKGFQTVLNLVENTCKDSFDLFFGLYFYNKYAANQLQKIREALSQVERQLAAKEAYLAAKSEVNTDQRNRILEECRSLMKEALQEAIANPNGNSSILDSKVPSDFPVSTMPAHNE